MEFWEIKDIVTDRLTNDFHIKKTLVSGGVDCDNSYFLTYCPLVNRKTSYDTSYAMNKTKDLLELFSIYNSVIVSETVDDEDLLSLKHSGKKHTHAIFKASKEVYEMMVSYLGNSQGKGKAFLIEEIKDFEASISYLSKQSWKSKHPRFNYNNIMYLSSDGIELELEKEEEQREIIINREQEIANYKWLNIELPIELLTEPTAEPIIASTEPLIYIVARRILKPIRSSINNYFKSFSEDFHNTR